MQLAVAAIARGQVEPWDGANSQEFSIRRLSRFLQLLLFLFVSSCFVTVAVVEPSPHVPTPESQPDNSCFRGSIYRPTPSCDFPHSQLKNSSLVSTEKKRRAASEGHTVMGKVE